jgi:hypothetical protein
VIRRLGLHLALIPVWAIGFMMLVPFGWILMNDAAWRIGVGDVLTERPIAAVHHRVMGKIDEFDDASEAISYYEGHLRAMPDAPEATKREWHHELDQAHSARTRLLIGALIISLVAYLPIGWWIDRYFGLSALAKTADDA